MKIFTGLFKYVPYTLRPYQTDRLLPSISIIGADRWFWLNPYPVNAVGLLSQMMLYLASLYIHHWFSSAVIRSLTSANSAALTLSFCIIQNAFNTHSRTSRCVRYFGPDRIKNFQHIGGFNVSNLDFSNWSASLCQGCFPLPAGFIIRPTALHCVEIRISGFTECLSVLPITSFFGLSPFATI